MQYTLQYPVYTLQFGLSFHVGYDNSGQLYLAKHVKMITRLYWEIFCHLFAAAEHAYESFGIP